MKPLCDMTEPELADYFTWIARRIESALPPLAAGTGGRCSFVLLVADDSGIAQYVSNVPTEERVRMLRATADRMEAREVVTRVDG